MSVPRREWLARGGSRLGAFMGVGLPPREPLDPRLLRWMEGGEAHDAGPTDGGYLIPNEVGAEVFRVRGH